MSNEIPKAVLYYAKTSVWCAVVLLALEEKGYGADEIDLKLVDLAKGENFALSFLRVNSKATVPTLVVPMQRTLTSEVESRYKAITDSKPIVEFLDRSRSSTSFTHTTSSAPAPSLTPATISFATKSSTIIDVVHSEAVNPHMLYDVNARDLPALRRLAETRLPRVQGASDALAACLAEAESKTARVSEKTEAFWRGRKEVLDALLSIYADAGKGEEELDEEGTGRREMYFARAKDAWEVHLRDALIKINGEIIGPFVLGDQLSIADLHLAAWLARLVKLAGGDVSDDGNAAISKVGKHIGVGFALATDLVVPLGPTSKLAAFWSAMKERPSWKKVYREGLI